MNWNNFTELMKVLVLAAGARGLFEAGQSHNPKTKPLELNPTVTSLKPSESKADLFSPQKYREWAKKAVRKYAQAQEKKWENWAASMRK